MTKTRGCTSLVIIWYGKCDQWRTYSDWIRNLEVFDLFPFNVRRSVQNVDGFVLWQYDISKRHSDLFCFLAQRSVKRRTWGTRSPLPCHAHEAPSQDSRCPPASSAEAEYWGVGVRFLQRFRPGIPVFCLPPRARSLSIPRLPNPRPMLRIWARGSPWTPAMTVT